jgi:hypothetical protein
MLHEYLTCGLDHKYFGVVQSDVFNLEEVSTCLKCGKVYVPWDPVVSKFYRLFMYCYSLHQLLQLPG